MSKPLKYQQAGENAGFEQRDLSAGGIFWFLLGLAVFLVIVGFVLNGMYGLLDRYDAQHQPPQNPLVTPEKGETRDISPESTDKFPQPRLENSETSGLNSVRENEERTLNSYGWIDEKSGVARIPIDRAMQLIVQQGLPTRARNGAIPPAKPNGTADVVKERGRLKPQ